MVVGDRAGGEGFVATWYDRGYVSGVTLAYGYPLRRCTLGQLRGWVEAGAS